MNTKSFMLYVLLLASVDMLQAQQKPAYKLFFEKVYLHTDRDVYMPGDTIWFKAYLVNAQNNTPIGTSGNLYVELINADSAKIGDREIIRLENGKGNGDFKLKDSIPSGRYTLRAYTNWMRNFGYNFVFEKIITVYNTEAKVTLSVAATESKKSRNRNSNNIPPVILTQPVTVHFYPEGGSLIEGLNSLMAVKAEDAAGKGITLKGAILNITGDTISRFSCDSLGMGMLSILPLAGQQYKASFSYKNRDYTTTLPQVLVKGLAMRISSNDSLLTVLITSNDTSINKLTLIGRHGGAPYFNQLFTFNKGQALLKIPKSMFPEGIAAITLYDEQNKPNCERLIYIHHQNNPTLTITTDKPVYQPKGKTTVKLKLSDTTQKANLSIAVVDESLVPAQSGNIASYLLLTSEIKGNIEHPERYFDTTNVNRFKQLDLLLMTQGWRDFLWRRIADSAIKIGFAAEPYITLSGKVRAKFADKPIRDMNISLTAFRAKGSKLLFTRTDSLGKYYFDNLQLYGQQVVSLNSTNDKGIKAGWITMDSLYSSPLPVRAMPVLQADSSPVIPHATIMAMDRRETDLKKHHLKDTIHLKAVTIKAPTTVVLRDGAYHTFGYPDQFFTIGKADEYFEDLGNWLAHNVAKAHIGDGPGNDIYFWGFTSSHILPTFIANGKEAYFVTDPPAMKAAIRNVYLSLPMDKVKKVTIRHLVGMDFYGNTGMVEVFLLYLTIDADAFDRVEFGKVTATVNGYYSARTFYKPVYDTPKDLNKPDYRTTIHWEPNITTDAKGEATVTFYNADPKTSVRIVAEGITAQGTPVVGTAIYQVK